MTTERDEEFEEKVNAINTLYQQALSWAAEGEAVVCIDEMTGVQALQRKYPGLPMRPGKVARREFEYIRHGTLSFIINFHVASGRVGEASSGPTRTETDFVEHIQRTVAGDPTIKKWHFIVDNLNTHKSASLVQYIADESDIDTDLGLKGESGILQSMQTRTAFLNDSSHRIVFYYTPKHASWMNQIEIWFSILVRKVLKRGNFTSIDDLKTKVLDFIDYFNQTMAKPFKWTYQGKALQA